MAFNVKTFYTRATTALVFVALLLGCVWYSYLSFVIFFIAVGFIGLNEFFKLSENLNAKPHKLTGYIFYFLLIISVTWSDGLLTEFFILILLFPFTLLIIELFKKDSAIINTAFTILAFMYVAIPCVLLAKIVSTGYNAGGYFPEKVLGMIFFVWINDTGAYFVGSFFGKHKLYEKISPNKTWEGTLGGIALCIALSFVVAIMFPQLATIHWVVISIIVAVFGNLGDLVESMLKRMAGVKDSGTLMPGHGGVLDRFDSLFFATPFVFCYLALMGLL
ncbi:MAG: phosphatidate cytidylyltransferase [Bacteroidia bacterium]